MIAFHEIADRVFVLTHPFCDVNITLITGDGGAVLVDTLSTERQARELAEHIERITTAPLTIVNTHFHFDHSFGNATLADRTPGGSRKRSPAGDIWGTPDCVTQLRENGAEHRRYWSERYSEPEMLDVRILPPNREVTSSHTLDIGGRQVLLSHHGRAHTAGDLVVCVDDVLIAGDLVEEGASPAFEDSYPLDWPETLAAVVRLAGPDTKVVPGHGAIVDHAFVKSQHDQMTTLDWLIRDGHGDGVPIDRVAAASPFAHFSARQAQISVKRGYAQLDVAMPA